MSTLFRRIVLGFTERDSVRRMFTERAAGRALATRFVAGETLDDAIAVARRINAAGMQISLDHLGEHVTSRGAADKACDAYLTALKRISSEGLDANISVKLSQLGLELDADLAAAHVDVLATDAARRELTITIDMEESAATQATLDLYRAAQAKHGNLGVAIQSYLYRTESDLEALFELGGHVRLCKGAYDESEAVAYQSSDQIDASFGRLLVSMMESEEVIPAIATHDDRLLEAAAALAQGRAAPWEFQMLYGVRNKLQQDFVSRGFPVRIYLPYGSQWYPYLTRRLAERPANLRFFLRAALGR